jgi:acyl-CoA reductase-like NAD-dependent aldehyde dehydrogenase
LKPSEISAHTAEVITRLIEENYDEEYLAVINGDGEMVGDLLVGHYHI